MMCSVCGCGDGETRVDGAEVRKEAPGRDHGQGHGQAHGGHQPHPHHHDRAHDHAHGHDHVHMPDGTVIHYGRGPAGVSVAGLDQPTLVRVERDILGKNDAIAARNRAHFARHGWLVLNLLSSPGSGKTTLLVKTLEALGASVPTAVIEGDQETTADADRIRATGVPALQINTGKGCHLDAGMVADATATLHPPHGATVFIENVGNLVCPAGFDLGEALRVVVASVTEGEDKPLKYPQMFAKADLVLVNKVDLLPHLDVDVEALVDNARKVNPGVAVIRLSARTGAGMEAWLRWIEAGRILKCAAE